MAPETMTDAVTLLAADGYRVDFGIEDTAARCPECHTRHDLTHSVIERQYRFEGPSDPGDEAIVLGLRCPSCGTRGVIASAYGPDADPELFALLARLPRARS